MRRAAVAVVVPLAVVTLIAVWWLWPFGGYPTPEASGPAPRELHGTVERLDGEACPQRLDDEVNGCGTATVGVADGPERGERVVVSLPNGPGAPELTAGDRVVLIASEGPEGETLYAVVDHQRSTGLLVLTGAFALAVVAFGRWRGLSALLGLAVTFGLLLWFVVPAILAGEPPLLVAIVGSAAIMLLVLYLTHGFSLTTTVAVLGTLASLTLTGVLAWVSVAGLQLSGITDDLSTAVGTLQGINMQGLLLAGIVIGSLGVLDDVTVTQAAAVSEIAEANREYGGRELYRSASRVGRAHIASVINTIVLAYAGSALPLLILIVSSSGSLTGVLTSQLIAQEIVRSVVATLGLVAAVPLTTGLAAWVLRRAR